MFPWKSKQQWLVTQKRQYYQQKRASRRKQRNPWQNTSRTQPPCWTEGSDQGRWRLRPRTSVTSVSERRNSPALRACTQVRLRLEAASRRNLPMANALSMPCPSPIGSPFSASDGEKVAAGRMRCPSGVEKVAEARVRGGAGTNAGLTPTAPCRTTSGRSGKALPRARLRTTSSRLYWHWCSTNSNQSAQIDHAMKPYEIALEISGPYAM
jgi:hypothetical protein